MQNRDEWGSGGVGSDQSVTQWHKTFVGKSTMLLFGAVFLIGLGYLVGNGKIKISGLDSIPAISSNSNNSTEDLSTDGLQELYDVLRKNYDGDVSAEKLLDGLKKGAVSAVGDTYTEYFTEEESKAFNDDLDGKFEGIGAELGQEDGFVVIVSPIKGAPAEKAGLQPKDIIIEIDGESSTDISVSEAVKRIRGEKGTDVKLKIVREGESLDFTITRDTIDIPSVEWRIENGIGIMEISQFNSDTATLAEKAAKEFASAGVKKVILDVRGDPGGLLDQAISVADIWLDKGQTILKEKQGGEVVETFSAKKDPILKDVETIVLINQGSASASEIVAGALKDNNKATLLGEKSYGKGSVQQLIPLKGGGALKVTIARWYTPGDKNIDKEGLSPDVEVKRTIDDIKAKRDPQLDEAKSRLQ